MTESDPTQTPPPDAALPVEVAVSRQLAALREENAALAARVRELETPPPNVALPGEVERAFRDLDDAICFYTANHTKYAADMTADDARDFLHEHIAALTARVRELEAEAPPAIPDEVEAALVKARGAFSMFSHAEREDALNTLENHITAQAREIERLEEIIRNTGDRSTLPDCAFVPGEPCLICDQPLTPFATCEGSPDHTTGLTWDALRRVHATRAEMRDSGNARIAELATEIERLRGDLVIRTNSQRTLCAASEHEQKRAHAAGFAEGLRWVYENIETMDSRDCQTLKDEIARREGGAASD